MQRLEPIALGLLMLAGCTVGTMAVPGSVKQHQDAAGANLELAAAHDVAAANVDPCAEEPEPDEVCWTPLSKEPEHRRSAQRHRRLAEGHAAAASALRAAEEEACKGVAPADRDTSPFLRKQDIQGVEMLDGSLADDESEIPVARVTFEKVARLEFSSLQRIVRCHLARNAALGHDVPEMDWCPLVPPGVHATVSNADGQLQITLFASEMSIGEVRRRIGILVAET